MKCSKCNLALKWLDKGSELQTANGFLIAKIPGFYCPQCAGSYGGKSVLINWPVRELKEKNA